MIAAVYAGKSIEPVGPGATRTRARQRGAWPRGGAVERLGRGSVVVAIVAVLAVVVALAR